jgi:hypothetical protein
VDFAAVVEDSLGDRGFTGIDMRDDADIANLAKCWLGHDGVCARAGWASARLSLTNQGEVIHAKVVELKIFTLQFFDVKSVESAVVEEILA